MASSNSVKDCPICQEEYDEEVSCPRSLPCSHTICSKCIGNLISRNYKTCPFCIRVFHATAARDIGMNTSLLDVLKVLREIESKVYISQMPTAGIASDKMNDIKIAADDILNKLLDSFLEEDDEIETNLQSNDQLTSYFLQANDTMKKEVLSHINEVMAQNVNRIKYLQEHSRRLHLRKEVIKEKRKEVTDVKRKLTSSSTFMHVGASLDEVESIQTDAEDSKRTFKCGLSEDERVRLKLERVSKTMKDNITKLKEAVKPTEKDDEIHFIPDLQHMKIPKKMEMGIRIAQFPLPIPQQVTTETLRSRTAFVMDLVKQGQIFAVQKQAGRIIYAQISLEEKNRVVLHYLREQIIPANAHLLNHNDVLRLVNASSRLVFLELQSYENKHTLGKLYIRLSPNTKRARQFAILCSGEKEKLMLALRFHGQQISAPLMSMFFVETMRTLEVKVGDGCCLMCCRREVGC